MDSQNPKKSAPKVYGVEDGSNREDSNRNNESGFKRFAKDKRARVGTRVEKISRERKTDHPREERPERPREDRPYGEQRPRRENWPGNRDERGGGRDEQYRNRGGRDDRGEGSRNRGGYDDRNRGGGRDERGGGGYADRDNRNDRRSGGDAPRRSYNPNFTPDNRPKHDNAYQRRDSRDFADDRARKPYNDDDKWNRVDYDPSREERSDRGGRPGGHDRPGGYGKPGGYKKSGGYEKSGSYERSGGYGKPGSYEKSGGYGKPGGGRPDRPPRPDFGKQSGPRGRNDHGGGGHKKYGAGGGRHTQRAFRPGDEYPKYAPPKLDKPIRLNRFLAMSGIASRREADDLILAGVVTVNGQIVSELGTKVQPTDEVRFNDSVVHGEKKVYILMNKPKGFVTTLEDPHSEKTVMDIIKGAVTERVYPVGRLDKNSVGVLLITNDGDLTKRLTHPSYKKKKIYQVSLDKALARADMEEIASGVELDDGPIHADEIAYVGENKREIGIEIHSGRNRVVRRIFEQFGYKVQKLDRVYFAGLTKKRLKRGAWRFLTPKEVAMLKSGEYE